ncbi:hypothetical protein Tco_1205646 [Tanacetum coccineum]
MPPKRTSTSAAPAMTQAAIKKLVADSVAAALEAQAANMANTDKNTGTSETLVARKGINDHKRKFDDRRNTTTNNDNNYSNNRNNNNYRDNHNNHNHAPCITQEFALSGARLATRWVIGPGTAEAKDQSREATCDQCL